MAKYLVKMMLDGDEYLMKSSTKTLLLTNKGSIVHDVMKGEIVITRDSDGSSITIADKNVGASEYLGQSDDETKSYGDYYCWGGKEPYVTQPTNEKKEDWTLSQYQSIAPEGWHIPSKDEWQSVIDLFVSVSGYTASMNGDKFAMYLKLPVAGYREEYGAELRSQDSDAYYWSSTLSSNDFSKAYGVSFNTYYVDTPKEKKCSIGYSIRLFKDS